MGGGQAPTTQLSSTSFLPVTSTSVGLSSKTFLTLSLNGFATLKTSREIHEPVPKLLSLNQEYPSKKLFFLVKSFQNWGYDKFFHTNAAVTKLWSHGRIYNIILVTWQCFAGDAMDKSYDIITFILKYLYFRKA